MNIVVNTDFINTIITSIITSEIIGVFISEYYQRKTLVKKMKRDFVIELFANRYILNESYLGEGNELNRTLGKIPIIFSDNKEIINCYDNFLSVINDKNFLRLIKSVCMDKNVNIDISNWNTEYCSRDEVCRKKSTLRGIEDAKIKCAEAFFKQLTIDGYTVTFHTQLSSKNVKQIIEEVLKE